jgi:hypothetical protein
MKLFEKGVIFNHTHLLRTQIHLKVELQLKLGALGIETVTPQLAKRITRKDSCDSDKLNCGLRATSSEEY